VKKRKVSFFVTIEEPNTELKKVTIPARGWAAFLKVITPIKESVTRLQSQQYVKIFTHFGGRFFVSATTGFRCVDIHRVYYDSEKDSNQAKSEGIALIMNQWSLFQKIMLQNRARFPVNITD
jgi:hypothetical protein